MNTEEMRARCFAALEEAGGLSIDSGPCRVYSRYVTQCVDCSFSLAHFRRNEPPIDEVI